MDGGSGQGTLENRFGKFRLVNLLGVGGMAEVYLAEMVGPEGFHKLVALKRLLAHLARDNDFVESFIHEARLGGSLNHPNIVQTLELGRIDFHLYLALEYVEGITLAGLLRHCAQTGNPLPIEVIVDLTLQICDGLAYAHTAQDARGTPLQLIHRDLKPDNILLSRFGVAKISDFGVARAQSGRKDTVAGTLKGTLRYMSPEQACCDPLDQRSDLFSLGAILFEMVTLEQLYNCGQDLKLIVDVQSGRVGHRLELLRAQPERLQRLIGQLLAIGRDGRPSSALEVKRALHALSASGAASRERLTELIRSVAAGEASSGAATLNVGFAAPQADTRVLWSLEPAAEGAPREPKRLPEPAMGPGGAGSAGTGPGSQGDAGNMRSATLDPRGPMSLDGPARSGAGSLEAAPRDTVAATSAPSGTPSQERRAAAHAPPARLHLARAGDRALYARLAVFAGAVPEAAIEAICAHGGGLPGGLRGGLANLMALGMVERRQDAHGASIFGLLPEIREHAAARLEERGERAALQQRHANHFLSLAEHAANESNGTRQGQWLAVLDTYAAELDGALRWALKAGATSIAIRMGSALAWYWGARGQAAEGRQQIEAALASPDLPVMARAMAVTAAAGLCLMEGDYERAGALFEEDLKLQETIGDAAGMARALYSLGLLELDRGELSVANRRLSNGLERAKQASDPMLAGRLQVALGATAVRQRDQLKARQLLLEGRARARQAGDEAGAAEAQHQLAILALRQQNDVEALSLFRESLAVWIALDDRRSWIEGLEGAAAAFSAQGDMDRAARLLAATEAARERLRMPRTQSCLLALYLPALSAIRSSLPADALNSLWQAGGSLSLEEASTLVLPHAGEIARAG